MISMSDKREFMVDLAYQAGSTLLEYFREGNLSIVQKIDKTLVTNADIQSDRMIINAIKDTYPNDPVISEELTATTRIQQSESAWIIDPLDGTTNFALGLNYWGVVIANIIDGCPNSSVCYYPALKECYYAQKGNGAYLNNMPIKVEDTKKNQKLSFFSCCSRTHKKYQVSIPYKIRILGCASYSICCTARGISRVSFEAEAKIWDIAGAWLIVNEAGGIMDVLYGNTPFPMQLDIDYNQFSYPTLAVPNPEILKTAKNQIIRK